MAQKTLSAFDLIKIKDQSLAWLSSMQLPCGAIAYDRTQAPNLGYVVSPYFSSIAAKAFLTNSSTHLNCRAYIDWYYAHMRCDDSHEGVYGSVIDYWIDDSGHHTPRQTNDAYCDSVDSYAALFASLLRSYSKVTGDMSVLTERVDYIQLIYEELEAMYDAEAGLTIARPSHAHHYLMDNCEVFGAYRDLEYIFKYILHDRKRAMTCWERSIEIASAIEAKLWDPIRLCYNYALEAVTVINGDFYPNVLCQIYPSLYDLYDGVSGCNVAKRDGDIYYEFAHHAPYAGDLTYIGSNEPNCEVMLFALKMRAKHRGNAQFDMFDLTSMIDAMRRRENNSLVSYYSHDVARLIRACDAMIRRKNLL